METQYTTVGRWFKSYGWSVYIYYLRDFCSKSYYKINPDQPTQGSPLTLKLISVPFWQVPFKTTLGPNITLCINLHIIFLCVNAQRWITLKQINIYKNTLMVWNECIKFRKLFIQAAVVSGFILPLILLHNSERLPVHIHLHFIQDQGFFYSSLCLSNYYQPANVFIIFPFSLSTSVTFTCCN